MLQSCEIMWNYVKSPVLMLTSSAVPPSAAAPVCPASAACEAKRQAGSAPRGGRPRSKGARKNRRRSRSWTFQDPDGPISGKNPGKIAWKRISYDGFQKWENHGILDWVLMGNAMTNIFIRISGNFSVGFFMGTQVSPSPVHMVSQPKWTWFLTYVTSSTTLTMVSGECLRL